jgi:hypothetical protein
MVFFFYHLPSFVNFCFSGAVALLQGNPPHSLVDPTPVPSPAQPVKEWLEGLGMVQYTEKLRMF